MCGITGYINLDSTPLENSLRILSMLKVQKHRGPDDSGVRIFDMNSGRSEELHANKAQKIREGFNGIIGFNRLSILDLSYNGHQPMMSRDEKVILTLNGEIYNAFEYKEELEQWGYNFKSTTDTEVVLALYLKYGFEEMLKRLNGMFAIVIIDLFKKRIFLTRDRFGIKPLYYIKNNRFFAFSSELKSFKYLTTFKLNEDQLDEYILFRNNHKGTLFRNIHSLEPGTYITLDPSNEVKKYQFFNVNNLMRTEASGKGIEDYYSYLEEGLGKSVQRQLISDVKLGCQLSGGIDSSLVTWLANKKSTNGNFEAVSIIFNDPRFSKEEFINKVTNSLAIKAHKFLLDSDYYFEKFVQATWHLETPINHPNTIAIYKLSQRAKEYVTVLLSGEGADEVFGGYERFYSVNFPFTSKKILVELKRNLKYPENFLKYLEPAYRTIMATSFISPGLASNLKKGFDLNKAYTGRASLYNELSGSLFDKQVKYEMLTYLPDLLIRQDKMSMAHSIENRVPFLDNELVNKSFHIPEKYLLTRKTPEGHNTEKYLLKKLTESAFGSSFAFRDKMGFGIPVRSFFMNSRFDEYIKDEILPGIRKRGIFNHKLISHWHSELTNLKFFEIEALWVSLAFEIWASVFLDGNNENWDTSY